MAQKTFERIARHASPYIRECQFMGVSQMLRAGPKSREGHRAVSTLASRSEPSSIFTICAIKVTGIIRVDSGEPSGTFATGIAGPASWKYLHQSTVSTLATHSTTANPILGNLNQDVTSILLCILSCVLLSRLRSGWSARAENCLGVRDSNPATGRSYCRRRVDT